MTVATLHSGQTSWHQVFNSFPVSESSLQCCSPSSSKSASDRLVSAMSYLLALHDASFASHPALLWYVAVPCEFLTDLRVMELMLGLCEALDQLSMASSVRWYGHVLGMS